jgi:hypothetical protein
VRERPTSDEMYQRLLRGEVSSREYAEVLQQEVREERQQRDQLDDENEALGILKEEWRRSARDKRAALERIEYLLSHQTERRSSRNHRLTKRALEIARAALRGEPA